MGEAGTAEETSKEEVLSRLEALGTLGFVERLTTRKGETRWAFVNKKGGKPMFKKLSGQSKTKAKKVSFALFAPEAHQVTLVGDFNGWDINSLPMKRNRSGTWETRVVLSSGRHEYLFWVDGVWQEDPKADDRVANPFGSRNSVRTVE
jgi:1,4-alpha-glucan branching enzyme